MNDLHWIQYEPKRMFLDTIGMSDAGERAHRRLSDYIWWNEDAPPNDNEVLRSISSTEPTKWGKVKLELIGKGWVEGATAFFHRAVVKSLNESNKSYVANINRTVGAHNAKNPADPRPMLELLPPNPETGVLKYIEKPYVAKPVTRPVTRFVTKPVTSPQSESEPEPQSTVSKGKGLTSKPSVEGGAGETTGNVPVRKKAVPSKGDGNVPLMPDGSPDWKRIGWTPFRPGTERELEVLALTMETLGSGSATTGQWVQNSTCWGNRIYGSDRVPAEPDKVRRVMLAVQEAAKNGEIKTTPAQFAAHCWKTFAS